jgi:tRNA G46 methylase TrmB
VTCGASFRPDPKLTPVDSATLAAEYAFALSRAGKLYIVTDVADLFRWMVEHLAGCPLFREATPEEQQADAVVTIVSRSTEESRKAEREGRSSWSTVFIRL